MVEDVWQVVMDETPSREQGSGGWFKWILGLVLTAAVGEVVHSYMAQRDEPDKLSQQQQLVQQQAALQTAVEEKRFRNQEQARAVEELERRDRENLRLGREWAGNYYSVVFENHCDAAITYAIRYTELDRSVYVKGWFTIRPNERFTVLNTQVPWFEYSSLDGMGRPLSGGDSFRVSSGPFHYVEDGISKKGTESRTTRRWRSSKK